MRWLNITEATSPYRCKCDSPYAPLFQQQPFDCSGSVCAPNGIRNPFYSAVANPALWCICSGKYRTDCTEPSGCRYCSVNACLNGGYPPTASPNVCVCPFPYVSGSGGICELDLCSASNTQSVEMGLCRCKPGYLGHRCDESLCLFGGQFNATSGFCQCTAGRFGTYCEVSFQEILPFLNLTTPTPPAPETPVAPSSAVFNSTNLRQCALLLLWLAFVSLAFLES